MKSNQIFSQFSTLTAQPLHPVKERPVFGRSKSILVLISCLLLSMMLLVSSATNAKPNTDDTATIEYLIEYVSKSDMIFVRNFGKHTPQRAAKHIQDKYDHFFDDIDSPETFIALCATKSLITGRDYTVIDPHGNKIKTSDWLLATLNAHREQSR